MAVIKSQNAQTLLKDAVVLDLGDLRRQAAALQQASQAQARRIITQAQEEAARLTSNAHAKGFEQGLREGLDKGTQQGLAEGRKQGHAQALEQTSAQLQQIQQAWIGAAVAWTTPLDNGGGAITAYVVDYSVDGTTWSAPVRVDATVRYVGLGSLQGGVPYSVRVRAVNEATSEVPLFAAEDVEVAGTLRKGLDSMFHLALGLIK